MAIAQGIQQRADAITAALASTTAALTGPVQTSLNGIVGDIQHLKQLVLEGNTAELEAVLDPIVTNATGVAAAVQQLGASLAQLDAQTTPPASQPPGPTPDPDAPPVEQE